MCANACSYHVLLKHGSSFRHVPYENSMCSRSFLLNICWNVKARDFASKYSHMFVLFQCTAYTTETFLCFVEDIYVSLLRFIILLTRNKEINLKFSSCNHDYHWLNPLLFFEKNASFNGATHKEITIEVVLHGWKYCVVLRHVSMNTRIPILQNTRSFLLFIT